MAQNNLSVFVYYNTAVLILQTPLLGNTLAFNLAFHSSFVVYKKQNPAN